MEKIKIIYGIGNEGKEYEKLKHNLGKEIINFYIKEKKFLKNSYYGKFDSLILASNLCFINNCGKGLKELILNFKLKPENVLVIHDDADLIFPYFKTSFNSGSGGHKGIESIIKNLKTKKFWRLRIGIQGKKRRKAEEIVLKKWSKEEEKILEKIKKNFKIVLEKLNEGYLPNELNLSKGYFLNERNI